MIMNLITILITQWIIRLSSSKPMLLKKYIPFIESSLISLLASKDIKLPQIHFFPHCLIPVVYNSVDIYCNHGTLKSILKNKLGWLTCNSRYIPMACELLWDELYNVKTPNYIKE